MAPRTLLIPSLLDDWFPLLQYAFRSDRWTPVLLTDDTGLADLGLRYIHSDMCYPAHLVTGQILSALNSGTYDPDTCGILVGQAGDECRGSCLIRILRKVLVKAGYPNVTLLSLNVQAIEPQDRLPIRPSMVFQALAEDDQRGNIRQAVTCRFGQERHGTGRTGVNLDHEHVFVLIHNKLDVVKTDNANT